MRQLFQVQSWSKHCQCYWWTKNDGPQCTASSRSSSLFSPRTAANETLNRACRLWCMDKEVRTVFSTPTCGPAETARADPDWLVYGQRRHGSRATPSSLCPCIDPRSCFSCPSSSVGGLGCSRKQLNTFSPSAPREPKVQCFMFPWWDQSDPFFLCVTWTVPCPKKHGTKPIILLHPIKSLQPLAVIVSITTHIWATLSSGSRNAQKMCKTEI